MNMFTLFISVAALLVFLLMLILYFIRRNATDRVADIAGQILTTRKFGGGILDGSPKTSRKVLASSVVVFATDWIYAIHYGHGFLGPKAAGYLFLFIIISAIASFGRRNHPSGKP